MRWISTSVVAGLALSGLLGCDSDEANTKCSLGLVVFGAIVIDQNGEPIEGAFVEAHNVDTGKRISARTEFEGRSYGISEEIGAGAVRIVATHDGMSRGIDTHWSCDACHCFPDPAGTTFQLMPTTTCTADILKLLITVVDSAGNRVGATVTATHVEDARVMSVSSENGYYWIDETQFVRSVGDAGTTRIVAELGDRKVERDVAWTCDACHCFPESMEVTLTLPD